MSEIIKERVRKSIGEWAKVFLINGFKFEGKITNFDDNYFEILDVKSGGYKTLRYEDIKDISVSNNVGGSK